MIARCHIPSATGYANYGARGIYVCSQWRYSFETFLRDMGECPEGMSLERTDNAAGYSAENCVWAGRETQNNNRRNNRVVFVAGETATLSEAASKHGIPYDIARSRINRGWGDDAALTEDVRRDRQKRFITANGETHPVAIWAARLGIAVRSLHLRIQRGWSEVDAVTAPKDSTRRHRKDSC